MLQHTEAIRVRYGETDKMGYVYYGHYALYYEIGRVELLRKIGIVYNDLENQGIGLPVISYEIKYLNPAKYDDIITLKTNLREMPITRINFQYESFNADHILLNIGSVSLAFTDLKTGKPRRCPHYLSKILKPLLSE